MPSIVRFLVLVLVLGSMTVGGLYVMAEYFEPTQEETRQTVPGVKIKR
ncbi:MAG: hypothetical protein AAFR04_07835 [Pseudomonadota bacterium]